ncbi:MAG: hypothetical protein QGH19_03295 [Candidatus Woesearchaeota archaeon]|jgi:hypothetical protein|nr:hypothetical protein [Candidatus Woesearchaeota archaeon]MDP7610766.1 hypothetical protein [Candidatus Woesearchaeota archaeon]|tara:strand:+ start:581 stop:916 length:336 start_codon:yes stop_codon:yes gene_type:complete
MNAEELRLKIKQIFGEQIEFNKDFDRHSLNLGNQVDNLLEWCNIINEGKVKPIPAPKFKEGITFIKKIGSTNRCIVIKLRNKEFKEIHLGDHTYYDRLRKVLGLKKDNKYY